MCESERWWLWCISKSFLKKFKFSTKRRNEIIHRFETESGMVTKLTRIAYDYDINTIKIINNDSFNYECRITSNAQFGQTSRFFF